MKNLINFFCYAFIFHTSVFSMKNRVIKIIIHNYNLKQSNIFNHI